MPTKTKSITTSPEIKEWNKELKKLKEAKKPNEISIQGVTDRIKFLREKLKGKS